MELDISGINIPYIIKSEQYINLISSIQSYEDTLTRAFKVYLKNELINNIPNHIKNPLIYLWELNDFFDNIKPFDINILNIDNKEGFIEEFNDIINKNIVIFGPMIRSYLINPNEYTNKIRNDLYLFRINDIEWCNLFDLDKFESNEYEYSYITEDDIKISLIKNKYLSPSHVILQREYMKRIGWFNGKFYGSSMFLIEYQKHKKIINLDFRDPILNIPYDPYEIYTKPNTQITHPIKIINMIDYIELTKLNKKHLYKLYNNKTCLEHLLDKIIYEHNPIINNQIRQMILYLCGFKYKRPPYLYAQILNINNLIPDLYELLKTIKCEYDYNGLEDKIFYSLEDINLEIITQIAQTNNFDKLIDYIKYSKTNIDKNVLDIIINVKSHKIQSQILSNKLLEQNLIYYLILMSENLNLVNLIEFDFNIAVNYLKEVVENCKIRTFYYLYEIDNSIIDMKYDNDMNILHIIKPIGNYNDMIKLIIKLKPELINMYNSDNKTPVLYHAEHNPILVKIFLEYDFDSTLCDSNGNTYINILCMYSNLDILKIALRKHYELIDMPNRQLETPILISTKHNKEDVFYMLKNIGANIHVRDIYGNTIYHYICANKMCIGMTINISENYFGLTPLEYCKISPKYYSY